MPSKYLFAVNSKPTGCDDDTWEKWYSEEHIPDLVSHKASTRAAIYRETYDVPSLNTASSEKPYPRKYMAIYQTDHEQVLNTKEYKGIHKTSELFKGKRDSAVGDRSDVIMDNGEFDARNYELVDVFDPRSVGESPAPIILWAELEYEGGDHLMKFYKEEHFPLLGKVPGYRRGLRYKIGPDSPLMQSKPAKFLAIHDWDSKNGMERTPEMDAVTQTEWTKQVMSDVKFAVIRTFELIKAVGYD